MHIIYRLLLIFQAGTLPETNQQFPPLKLGPKKIAPISENRLNSSSPTIHFSGAKKLAVRFGEALNHPKLLEILVASRLGAGSPRTFLSRDQI